MCMNSKLNIKQVSATRYEIWCECKFSRNGIYTFGTADWDGSQFVCFHSGHNNRLIGYASSLDNITKLIERSLKYGSYYDVDAPVFHFYC